MTFCVRTLSIFGKQPRHPLAILAETVVIIPWPLQYTRLLCSLPFVYSKTLVFSGPICHTPTCSILHNLSISKRKEKFSLCLLTVSHTDTLRPLHAFDSLVSSSYEFCAISLLPVCLCSGILCAILLCQACLIQLRIPHHSRVFTLFSVFGASKEDDDLNVLTLLFCRALQFYSSCGRSTFYGLVFPVLSHMYRISTF